MRRKILLTLLAFFLITLVACPRLILGVDTDKDGIVNALDPDSDGDGLSDWDEVNRYWSDPYNTDSDGDGIDDGREVRTGTSPIDVDSDGDHLSDTIEYALWNPNAPTLEEKYYRCPYIADLPAIHLNIDGNRIVKHYTFVKGSDMETVTTNLLTRSRTFKSLWKHTSTLSLGWWGKLWIKVYLEAIAHTDPKKTGAGVVINTGGEAGFEAKGQTGLLIEANEILVETINEQDLQKVEEYSSFSWDYSTITIYVNISIANEYDRTLRIDNILLNMIVDDGLVKSEPVSMDNLVLRIGENRAFTAAFTVSNEEWIYNLLIPRVKLNYNFFTPSSSASGMDQAIAVLSLILDNDLFLQQSLFNRRMLYNYINNHWDIISNNYNNINYFINSSLYYDNLVNILEVDYESFDFSVWSDMDGWISHDVIVEDVTSRCVKVELRDDDTGLNVTRWVTAYVDKLEGLDVRDLLDRLFIDYTFKYGRFIDIMGIRSVPGEKVWMFAYYNLWYDMDEETCFKYRFEDLQLRPRGILKLYTESDSDGDWLPDSVEDCIGTSRYDPDTDDDYADDYVEVSILGSDPFNPDTDGGGTIDGVEYFEGLNVTDPSDDMLEMPEWYGSHFTVSDAARAANLLLSWALQPSSDQVTWPSLTGGLPNVSLLFDGVEPYASNTSLGLAGETILSLACRDLDGDPECEVVAGTYPTGYLLLFDYDEAGGQWVSSVICNFSEVYGVSGPIRVWGVAVGDANNQGENKIVAGTWYKSGGVDTGKVHMFYRQGSNWVRSTIDGSIPGGVYSVAVGDADDQEGNEVVVGQGGVDSLRGCNVTIYRWTGSSWSKEDIVSTHSSRIHVCIGDLGPDQQRVVAYCSYAPNTTLGFAEYKAGTGWENHVIDEKLMASLPPTYQLYMWVGIGDPDNDTVNELVVAVDGNTLNNDSICLYDNGILFNITDSALEFYCPELAVGDVDNDGVDEVVFHNHDLSHPLYGNVSIREMASPSSWTTTFIENTTPLLYSMLAWDVEGDGEEELVYGTDGQGRMVMWDHPQGYLWPVTPFSWGLNITMPSSWIFWDQVFPVEVEVVNHGEPVIEGLEVRVDTPSVVRVRGGSSQTISSIPACSMGSCGFKFASLSVGNYSFRVSVTAENPAISFTSNFTLLARHRNPLQVSIGQALLALAVATGNETFLEAAVKLANWLLDHRIEQGSYYAWNADPNCTERLLLGYVSATARTGFFLLNLYRVTGNLDFLDYAARAAHFLRVNASDGHWSDLPFGVSEAAEAGSFLLQVDQELLTDYFYSTITQKIVSYIISKDTEEGTDFLTSFSSVNWFESPKITADAAAFLGSVGYYGYVTAAGRWLASKAGDPSWLAGLAPSIVQDPYSYYWDLGLAGVLRYFGLDITVGNMYDEEVEELADRIVDLAYETSEGVNWLEPAWTSNVSRLSLSACMDYGAAGVAVALADAFMISGNQTYLDYAFEAGEWMESCLSAFEGAEASGELAGTLADIIASLLHVHYVMPVFTVGYFIDPLVSLNKSWFIMTGYLVSMGWHARNVELSVDLPGVFLLSPGETETKVIGDLEGPLVHFVSWNISLEISPYGEFTLGLEGTSDNAGSAYTSARVEVTDLGVCEVGEESLKALIHVDRQAEGTVHSIGEPVIIVVRAEYYDGTPAYNASVRVEGFGTAVVNASGYAYLAATIFEPGVYEVPVYLRYDRRTGITKGVSNATITLTFSSLEVYDVTVSSYTAFTGQQVVITGKVRYGHDHSPAGGALVCFNGLFNVTADENGVFTITFTETTLGIWNYTITACMDGNGKAFLSTRSETVTIQWLPRWIPYAVVLIPAVAATAAGLVIIRRRKHRKTETGPTPQETPSPQGP